MEISVSIGYHFVPTDEELITCYLLRKATGFPLPWDHIPEKDVYGERANPWEVFADCNWDVPDQKDKLNQVVYVFTRLSKVGNGKTRIARRAGCGTWSGQTGAREIYDESGQLIGCMKMFTFEARNKIIKDDHWIMHEYSLAGISLNWELKYKDYVLCRIKRSYSDCKQKNPAPQISSIGGVGDHRENKKRSSPLLQEDEGVASCNKKHKEIICSSTGVGQAHGVAASSCFADVSFSNAHDMAHRMLADMSVSSPDSIDFREWTQEELDFLISA